MEPKDPGDGGVKQLMAQQQAQAAEQLQQMKIAGEAQAGYYKTQADAIFKQNETTARLLQEQTDAKAKVDAAAALVKEQEDADAAAKKQSNADPLGLRGGVGSRALLSGGWGGFARSGYSIS
jgi:phage repressor protein C with HTH and peptisase S24 domain